jgi:hypothetical protein
LAYLFLLRTCHHEITPGQSWTSGRIWTETGGFELTRSFLESERWFHPIQSVPDDLPWCARSTLYAHRWKPLKISGSQHNLASLPCKNLSTNQRALILIWRRVIARIPHSDSCHWVDSHKWYKHVSIKQFYPESCLFKSKAAPETARFCSNAPASPSWSIFQLQHVFQLRAMTNQVEHNVKVKMVKGRKVA